MPFDRRHNLENDWQRFFAVEGPVWIVVCNGEITEFERKRRYENV